MTNEEFIKEVEKLNIKLSEKQIRQFALYCDILLQKNKVVNLTAIKDNKGVYLKHFYDCITIFKANVIKENLNILDIGSGAGFPGIVIKIIEPKINLTIIDSNNKKISFLEELATNLELDNINFIHARAEDYFPLVKDSFDIVTSRAVANLNTLAELSLPFVKTGGYFIAMKGNCKEEVEEANYAISYLGGTIIDLINFNLPIENSERTIIKIRKDKKSPSNYPRKYDKIIKKPLKKN